MTRQKPIDERERLARPVARREALKGLGALAITAPGLAAIGCSDRTVTGDLATSTAGGGAGAPTPAAVGGQPAVAGASGGPAAGAAGGGAGRVGAAPVQSAVPSATGGAGGAGTSARAGNSAAAGSSGQPALAGASAVPAAGSGGAAVGGSAGGKAPGGDFIPVTFTDATSCTLTPTDPAGEGPFFIHEDEVMNDANLLRADMRENKPGVEFQLNLRLLDSDGNCMKPIAGVEVYTWHTDALGFYSGFADQDPDQAYMGSGERTVQNMDRFCRGMQISGEDGVVRFKTIYPGWYNGRAIHIHFLALRPGSDATTTSYRSKQSMVFTTQMYFAESFSRMIHENNDPYKTRASGTAYSKWVKPQNMTVNPTLRLEGAVAVGALNIVTSAMGSRR